MAASLLSPHDIISPPSDRHLRVDTDHHLCELMQNAVSRLLQGQVEVDVRRDRVLLSGRVCSWTEKQRAQECIRIMAGARVIENHLTVSAF
ncbi:MAG: BON domain-containing protein [Planctomycetaceae bacterium]